MTGVVQTVLGPVVATDLGITLMHEHVVPRPQVPTPPDRPIYAPRVSIHDASQRIRPRGVLQVANIVLE